MIGEPDELVPAGKPFLGLGDLLRLEIRLQAVGHGLAVALLERLERDRDGLVALLAQDLDVGAHARAVGVAELVERDLDLEDLDLLDELGRGRDEADLSREDLLG